MQPQVMAVRGRQPRRAPLALIAGAYLAFCAFSTFAYWRVQAASMSLEQAIETVAHANDPTERRSAMTAIDVLVRDAITTLREAHGDAATGDYAALVLQRIEKAAADARK